MLLAGVAPKNDVGKDYRDHLEKFIPILAGYQLNDAACYFRAWLDGELPLAPLLDISGWLGKKSYVMSQSNGPSMWFHFLASGASWGQVWMRHDWMVSHVLPRLNLHRID